MQALLAAVWRRKSKIRAIIHSDQESRFTRRVWQLFPAQQSLEASMCRCGYRHEHAVAESSFQILKRERIHRRTYLSGETTRSDVFDYIEMFSTPRRKHMNINMLSSDDFKIRQEKLNEASV
ncbi:IS3 family transposase [Neotabrizicola sp. sgz301269]|uniref:IS3 family transposase n=1 Tax=Neotabrizicola sp. sgz301269 TaxID=3276282 RepID=UPI003770103B